MSNGVICCNAVIIPPEEVRQAAIDASRKIAAGGSSKFRLGTDHIVPHISIHQFAFPMNNLFLVERRLEDVVWGRNPFELTLSSYSIYPGNAIFWDVDINDTLLAVHQQLVKAVNDVREGYISKLHTGCLTGEIDIGVRRRQNLAKWGNPLTMDTFTPHITLSVLDNPEAVPAAVAIAAQLPTMTFRVEAIYLANVGEMGICPFMPVRMFNFAG